MDAHTTVHSILEQQANIAALRKIRKDMDPASGVSVSIRRGPVRDDPDEDDRSRPWVTVEITDLAIATEVLDAAIDAANKSLDFRIAHAKRECGLLSDFLATLPKA
jgi:hypothetical protein